MSAQDLKPSLIFACDHALNREAVAAWLRQSGLVRLEAAVAVAGETMAACERHRPQIALFDLDDSPDRAMNCAAEVGARFPDLRVVLMCSSAPSWVLNKAKASIPRFAFVLKTDIPADVLARIVAAANGASDLPERVREALADGQAGTLSGRELEILQLIAAGDSKKEIASKLGLSVKTVDNHCTSLMHKLDIHDRVDLARYAIRERLVTV